MPYIAKNLSNFTLAEIKTLFKKGMRVYQSPQLDIIILPTTVSFGRVLVITPRKVGTAPDRNTVRRRIKALFYQKAFYEFNLDLCVIIKKPGVNYRLSELEPLLYTAIARFKQ